MTVKLTFEETMEMLVARHSTRLQGNYEWVDWDAIYSDLLDEGYSSDDASEKLDEFIETEGY